jgi:F-type H+-transporting ATPase subunit b
MELVKPAIGLLFWMVLAFSVLLYILGKFAWKPILQSLKEREDGISESLTKARQAEEKMAQLKAGHEQLMAEARAERDNILKEARVMKDQIISDAKIKASTEANDIVARAKEEINTQKRAAMAEIQKQVATFSVEIAEKLIRHELSNDEKQKALMTTFLKDVNPN